MSGIPLHSQLSAGSTVARHPPLQDCISIHALQGYCIALSCIALHWIALHWTGHGASYQERTPDQSDLT